MSLCAFWCSFSLHLSLYPCPDVIRRPSISMDPIKPPPSKTGKTSKETTPSTENEDRQKRKNFERNDPENHHIISPSTIQSSQLSFSLPPFNAFQLATQALIFACTFQLLPAFCFPRDTKRRYKVPEATE